MSKSALFDSITDVPATGTDRVAISGSHGGLFPASVASRRGLRAVVFHDAGIGLESAGIAGAIQLDNVGMPAACVDSQTAHIGDAKDTWANGVLSFVNETAAELGLKPGMRLNTAIEFLDYAKQPNEKLPTVPESRQSVNVNGQTVLCLDSASLVTSDDAGAVIVTGSHGALIGGDPARALKARARLAVFNDAGFGKDNIGITRLPALDSREIGGLTVSHDSCRIGDALSALETGIISAVNETARKEGAENGMPLKAFIEQLAR